MSATGFHDESSPAAFARAAERGAAFLEGQLGRDGLWHDFRTFAGVGSEWVSGFVAHALIQAGRDELQLTTALEALIARQRRNGGWGYNGRVGSDCDSTAWVLLALTAFGSTRPSVVRRAREYLLQHRYDATGGFATYGSCDAVERSIGADDASARGWRSAHVCVTAVTAQALLCAGVRSDDPVLAAAMRYLQANQHEQGSWEPYWWTGYTYATYHALKALAWGDSLDSAALRRAQCTIARAQSENGDWGSAFESAFAILTLIFEADEHAAVASRRGARRLVAQQDGDGGWPPAPILRIPPPMPAGAWPGTGIVVVDQRRLFSTAAAVHALSLYAQSVGLSSAVRHAVTKC